MINLPADSRAPARNRTVSDARSFHFAPLSLGLGESIGRGAKPDTSFAQSRETHKGCARAAKPVPSNRQYGYAGTPKRGGGSMREQEELRQVRRELERTRRRCQALDGLYELARGLLQSPDPDSLLDFLMRGALQALAAERGFIVLSHGE